MPDPVKLTIDGKAVTAPPGTLVIDAAKTVGIEIPSFCYYEGLSLAAACRMCLVEVEKMPKLMTACTLPVAEGMVVRTDTPQVATARKYTLEFLLTNHPLDCPVCDKGGECELQDMTFRYGAGESRYSETKVHTPEKQFSPVVFFDAPRCILCFRCVRVCNEGMGVNALGVINRGVVSEIAPNHGDHLECDECGACIDICPVGALTSGAYRYQTRPWEMTHVGTICTHCADGCKTTLGTRNDRIIRGNNRDRSGLNGEFLCIKGRYGFDFYDHPGRLQSPLVRVNGKLEEAGWAQALTLVAQKFNQNIAGGGTIGVIGSNHTTNEENYYLQKFAREVLATNNIDHHRTGDVVTLLDALSVAGGGALSTVPGGAPNAAPDAAGGGALGTVPGGAPNAAPDAAGGGALGTAPGGALDAAPSAAGGGALGTAPGGALDAAPSAASGGAIGTVPGGAPNAALSAASGAALGTVPGGAPDAAGAGRTAARLATVADLYERKAFLVLGADLALEHPLLSNQLRANYRHHQARIYAVTPGPVREDKYAAASVRGRDYESLGEKLRKEPELVILFDDSYRGEDIRKLVEFGASLGIPVSYVPLVDYSNSRGAIDMGLVPELLPGYKPSDRKGLHIHEMLAADLNVLWVVGANPYKKKDVRKPGFLVVQDMFLTETAAMADVVLPAACAYEKNGTITNVTGEVQRLKRAINTMGAKPDLEIMGFLAREMGVAAAMGPWLPDLVFEEIRGNVRGYQVPVAALATGGAAGTTPLDGRIPVESLPELVESDHNGLFASGTLGRYSKVLDAVVESRSGR